MVIGKYADVFRRDFSDGGGVEERVNWEDLYMEDVFIRDIFMKGALDFPVLFKKRSKTK